MPTYAVTGASGQLGRLAIGELLARGVPASDVIAVVRTRGKAADLADRGVQVREADYSRPQTLGAALAGVERLLLISSSVAGQRVAHHTNVIRAAKAAGTSRVVYTSMLNADDTTNPLAREHQDSERALREADVPFTLLRNGWYTENYTDQIGQYLEAGEILGATGNGRISAASRQDYATAAATALREDAEGNRTYELGGPAFDLPELARIITEITGTKVTYRDLPVEEYASWLQRAGLDEATAHFVAALDASIAHGDLETNSQDLAQLLGRPATPLTEVLGASDPGMMVALLLYGYSRGNRSSRGIERACREDVAYKVITAMEVPDHSTIAEFRRRHQAALAELFVGVLALRREAGLVSVGVIAVDGTKIKASASRDQNRSHEGIVDEAERTDREEDERHGDCRGDELPERFRSRESRRSALAEAKQRLDEKKAADAQDVSQEPVVEVELDEQRALASGNGREGWLREGRRGLDERREREQQPVARSRAERLAQAKRRLEEAHAVERAAHEAYVQQHRDERSRVLRSVVGEFSAAWLVGIYGCAHLGRAIACSRRMVYSMRTPACERS
jgi:NAD(P)H dehydrogenase (quinone)